MSEKGDKIENKIINLRFPYQDTWDISQEHLTFELKNLDLSFVNSLERILLSNIPSVGFNVRPIETSQLKIYKNNTPFENEFISHRIGLIPIHLNPDNFDPANYSFVINKENSSKDYMLVSSEDIQVIKLSDNQHLDKSQVRKIFPADPLTGGFVPITKIIPWEDKTLDKPGFHCDGRAIISTSIINSAFSQVSAVAHSFKIDPVVYKSKLNEYIKEQKTEYNRIDKILKDTDPSYEETPFTKTDEEMKKKFDLLEAERCFYKNEDEDPYWFNMLVESIGVHSPIALVEKGLEIMIKKVSQFRELLENPIDGQLEITKGYNNMDRAYCIRIYNENETLGNLLAAHLRKYYIEDIKDSQERLISAVGFNKTHPLEKSVLLYINPKKNKSNDWGVLRELIFEMCLRVINQAKDLTKELQSSHLYKSSVSIKKSKK
jgi:DNA-directed RNA polymerase subunit L